MRPSVRHARVRAISCLSDHLVPPRPPLPRGRVGTSVTIGADESRAEWWAEAASEREGGERATRWRARRRRAICRHERVGLPSSIALAALISSPLFLASLFASLPRHPIDAEVRNAGCSWVQAGGWGWRRIREEAACFVRATLSLSRGRARGVQGRVTGTGMGR